MSEHEVELASATGAKHFVEAVSPVNAEETEHRQVEAHTHAGASLEVERRELLHRCPAITCLGKRQGVDCGRWLEHEREVELHAESAVGIPFVAPRCELSVLITAHGNCLGGICIASRHAVAAEIEGLEGGLDVLVPRAEQSEVGAGHEHESPLPVRVGERSVGFALEFYLKVFNPFVQLL